MATSSPFPFLDEILDKLVPQPPAWLVQEGQHRLVLLLNHVLAQEPQATARLARQQGRTVLVQWRNFSLRLRATPAGLLDMADPRQNADLTLWVLQNSPLALVRTVISGDKPEIRIEGDVQLAAEVSWLVDHVRWDLEEDLSRIVGDTAAHTLGETARALMAALRQFTGGGSPSGTHRASP